MESGFVLLNVANKLEKIASAIAELNSSIISVADRLDESNKMIKDLGNYHEK